MTSRDVQRRHVGRPAHAGGEEGTGTTDAGPSEEPDPRSLPFGLMVRDSPRRLEYVPKELVDDQTQIFFAMVNDTDRNDFYWHALAACDLRGKLVLDIGAGSGILAMMAAKLGARRVIAVEECADLVRVARHNVATNGLAHVVEVRHGLSTNLELEERADVLVTETLGTWMTCEGMVQWCEDARERLLKESAQYVPQRGTQYAVLIQSYELGRLFACRAPYRGLDLSAGMELQDTASMLWSKRVGIRPSDLIYSELCAPFPLLEVDFGCTAFAMLPRQRETIARVRAGRVHAVLDFWVAEDAQGNQLTTDPRARRCQPWAYARDIAWGNGFQLVADEPDEGYFGPGGESLGAAPQPDDSRWACFPDVDVPSAGPIIDASDLRLCKCACTYYGHGGFVVAEGRAQFRSGSREQLLDTRAHVPAPGCCLYVALVGESGDWGSEAPAIPRPFDVSDGEDVRIVSKFDEDQRSARHFVARSPAGEG